MVSFDTITPSRGETIAVERGEPQLSRGGWHIGREPEYQSVGMTSIYHFLRRAFSQCISVA